MLRLRRSLHPAREAGGCCDAPRAGDEQTGRSVLIRRSERQGPGRGAWEEQLGGSEMKASLETAVSGRSCCAHHRGLIEEGPGRATVGRAAGSHVRPRSPKERHVVSLASIRRPLARSSANPRTGREAGTSRRSSDADRHHPQLPSSSDARPLCLAPARCQPRDGGKTLWTRHGSSPSARHVLGAINLLLKRTAPSFTSDTCG